MFSNMGINSCELGGMFQYSRLFYYATKKGNAPNIWNVAFLYFYVVEMGESNYILKLFK